ncbi:four helix bundle protein [Verrucomicrobia bacterium S94]|nr:four helix bundle protein [Verrucomicrobia bacterium S94]
MDKKFDLEERTDDFAKTVSAFVRAAYKDIPNIEDSKQVICSSGSVAANDIEADEALSKKDLLMRTGIFRKEARKSKLWLKRSKAEPLEKERLHPEQEVYELTCIFGAILTESSG